MTLILESSIIERGELFRHVRDITYLPGCKLKSLHPCFWPMKLRHSGNSVNLLL